jgi:hypothetical protein
MNTMNSYLEFIACPSGDSLLWSAFNSCYMIALFRALQVVGVFCVLLKGDGMFTKISDDDEEAQLTIPLAKLLVALSLWLVDAAFTPYYALPVLVSLVVCTVLNKWPYLLRDIESIGYAIPHVVVILLSCVGVAVTGLSASNPANVDRLALLSLMCILASFAMLGMSAYHHFANIVMPQLVIMKLNEKFVDAPQ